MIRDLLIRQESGTVVDARSSNPYLYRFYAVAASFCEEIASWAAFYYPIMFRSVQERCRHTDNVKRFLSARIAIIT